MRGSTDNRVMQLLGWSAAACWCVAWFLPVVEGYAGWAAFRAALEAPFRHSVPMRGEDLVPQLLSALTNVVFVVLFANWQRGQVTRPPLFLKVAIACLLLNLYWLVEMLRAGERAALLVGYYVWLAAFALMVTLGIFSVVSNRRTSKTPTDGTPA
jgi:hypothetical protein